MCYRSAVELKEWVNVLEKAIREHTNKQLSFLNMKFVSKNIGCEPLQLGYEVFINYLSFFLNCA